ncbi:putative rhomboid protein [Golovinomyces cichoracearum]|uniref:Rhomboid-type serine protease n=1 Tax=Golovinomyces cichoracearum TaxID=62708 RepID=A0A420IME9_9PEZI|nr:putative rhomboid protein [Golovinomyces cichoracearum]
MNFNHDDNSSSRHRPPNIITEYLSYDNTKSLTRADSLHNPVYLRNTSPESNDQLSSKSPLRPLYDESVFPLGGQQSKLNDNQSTSSHDSRIFEVQGQNPVSRDSYTDSIPLRNNPAFLHKDESVTDHVYDAPVQQSNFPGNQDKKTGGILSNYLSSEPTAKLPWMTYALTIIQCVVFIIEIIKNAQLTGSPIEFQPSFNPMIGPSPYILINMGARYTPCMHAVDGIQTRTTGGAINWPCPNTTSNNVADCQLTDLCGFNMPASKNPQYPGQNIPLNKFTNQPDQWFRFILPIFLHAGLIHIGFNMLLQVTLGKEIELTIGSIRFFLVYISSGIFGFVLGGNFAASGIASTGASGALFGILALNLLDLFYTWGERRSPMKDFAYLMLDIIISFVLGLLPGLDNFSHIGGFLMGLALGICILHSPNAFRKKINQKNLPYTPVSQIKMTNDSRSGISFLRSPVDFFRGRRIAWWAWWLVRVGSLVFVFIVFILLLKNFYSFRKTCSWCKYLSCIDINNWCDIGNLQLTTISGPT